MRIDPTDVFRAANDAMPREMRGMRPTSAKRGDLDAVGIDGLPAYGSRVAERNGKSGGAGLDDFVGQLLALEIQEHDRALVLQGRFKMLLVRRHALVVGADQKVGKMTERIRRLRHFRNGLSAPHRAALADAPGHQRIERRVNQRRPASDHLQRRRGMRKRITMAHARRFGAL